MSKQVPITIICGFLGAGKTTLINHLLREGFGGKKVAVIVNDFGKVSLDDALIANSDEDKMVLRNGCVCCSLLSDLTSGLQKLLADDAFEMIVLECSGVTLVAPLIQLFNEKLDGQVVVNDVVAVADAIRFPKLVKVVLSVKEHIRYATHILLNRCDQVDSGEILEIKALLQSYNDQAPITEVTWCKISYDDISGGMVPSVKNNASNSHADQWATCTMSVTGIEGIEDLRSRLRDLPKSVERLKGFVTVTTGEMLCVQYVPNDLQITTWPGEVDHSKQNRLTVIGTADMVRVLRENLDNCFVIL